VIIFLVFKFKRSIPLRIRRAKAVPGCDEKKVTHLGKNLFHYFKESQISKRETEGEQRNSYGRQGGIK